MNFFFSLNSCELLSQNTVLKKFPIKPTKILTVCRHTTDSCTSFYLLTYNSIFLLNCTKQTLDQIFSNTDQNFFKPWFCMSSIVYKSSLCLIGGSKRNSVVQRNLQAWSLVEKNWEQWEPLNIGRSKAAVCEVEDDLYVCGGVASEFLTSIERFRDGVWVCLGCRIAICTPCGMVQVSQGRVLFLGVNSGVVMQEINLNRKTVKILRKIGIEGVESWNCVYQDGILQLLDCEKQFFQCEVEKRTWEDFEAFLVVREALHFSLI